MSSLEQVSNLINCLTNDEDLQQELWLYYLEGNTVESFSAHLQELKVEFLDDYKLKKAIWHLVQNPISDDLSTVLENFSDFECSIVCCLMLGMPISQISAIKGISEVRIRQTISSIRYNSSWEKYHGIKKALE